jgi:hypothetical protein
MRNFQWWLHNWGTVILDVFKMDFNVIYNHSLIYLLWLSGRYTIFVGFNQVVDLLAVVCSGKSTGTQCVKHLVIWRWVGCEIMPGDHWTRHCSIAVISCMAPLYAGDYPKFTPVVTSHICMKHLSYTYSADTQRTTVTCFTGIIITISETMKCSKSSSGTAS